MAHVKGSAVKASIQYLEEQVGPATLQKILASLPPSEADLLRVPILQSNWYDTSMLIRLMEASTPHVQLPLGKSVAWEMGRHSAEYGIKTLYKIFFKVADVHFIIKRAPQVMVTYYDSGSMEVMKVGPKEALLHLVDFDEPHLLICDRLQGWMERVVELSGGKDVSLKHPKCMAKGDRVCEYNATWK